MSDTPTRASVQARVQPLGRGSQSQLRYARFLLLRIDDAAATRAWLRGKALQTLLRAPADDDSGRAPGEALSIAFTYGGLRAMGVDESVDFPFPTAFRGGMTEPDRVLAMGDTLRDWRWGDRSDAKLPEVQVLLAHYWLMSYDEHGPLADLALQQAGLTLIAAVQTCASYLQPAAANGASDDVPADSATDDVTPAGAGAAVAARRGRPARLPPMVLREPFGFRDGLSQPRLRYDTGLDTDLSLAKDHSVAAGEFFLGLRNQYGDPAYAPDVCGWPLVDDQGPAPHRFGSHGSYLAVRQIRQFVDEFEAFERAQPRVPAGQPSMTEKMMGRRKDGRPLVIQPPGAGSLNDFRYRMQDAEGFGCPIGAHVRRGNPRDSLGWNVRSGVANAKLHRLLRRARVFCEGSKHAAAGACAGTADPQRCGQGLFFMALFADFDRQFEFVQQRWLGNPQFGDLAGEDDPVIGSGRSRFTVPGPAVGRHCPTVPRFTQTIGGGYFFLPSLAALAFLARLQPASAGLSETVPAQGVVEPAGQPSGEYRRDQPGQQPDQQAQPSRP